MGPALRTVLLSSAKPFYPGATLALDFAANRYSGPSGQVVTDLGALGPELVVNGGFDDGTTTGWTASNSTLSVVGGRLRITATGGVQARATQTVSGLIAGRLYKFSAILRKPSGLSPNVGLFASGGATSVQTATYTASSSDTPSEGLFLATGSSHTLLLEISGTPAANDTGEFDLVSVREVLTGFQFTRTGAGTAEDTSGVYASFATNVPRRTNKGLLVEEGRTNLFLHSGDFTQAAWVKGPNASVAAEAGVAPDGTLTADRVTFSADASSADVKQTVTVTSGQTYTLSVWLKADTATTVQVFYTNGAASTIASNVAVALTSEWQRVVLTGVATDTGAILRLRCGTGQAAKSLYVWGAQLELGSFPTSPILTTGAAATRGVDNAKENITLPAGDFVAVFQFEGLTFNASAIPRLFSFSDGAAANAIEVLLNAATTVQLQCLTASVGQTTSSSLTVSPTGVTTVGIRRVGNRASICVNTGAPSQVSADWTWPSGINQCQLGNRAALDRPLSTFVRKGPILYPGTFSDAEFQQKMAA